MYWPLVAAAAAAAILRPTTRSDLGFQLPGRPGFLGAPRAVVYTRYHLTQRDRVLSLKMSQSLAVEQLRRQEDVVLPTTTAVEQLLSKRSFRRFSEPGQDRVPI